MQLTYNLRRIEQSSDVPGLTRHSSHHRSAGHPRKCRAKSDTLAGLAGGSFW